MNVKLTEQQKIKLLNSDDIFEIMRNILLRENKIDRDKEHFWIIGLASNSKALFIELVSLGSVNETVVEPMNVFRVAVLKNAVGVVLVHNHPSGELRPSKADKNITDRLIQVGKIINIEVVEHLIISPESYYSFVDDDLLDELKASLTFVPSYKIEERIRRQEKRLREEAVKVAEKKDIEKLKKQKIEIARSLKQQNIDIDVIAKASGLPVEDIDKL